ncbi:hypothetical protein TNIN_135301 [Trichonephila inaurata madagascariensis]|uniref:Uncharacterized protein n=1 Tax=Trichonephila inaurata madagascariensis TaxID=2747483 RepID=A0A8X6YVG0_9ARAC|nr:hypothetical protein TNIN_135301 [Trichonephila inaurata madagascariensis]
MVWYLHRTPKANCSVSRYKWTESLPVVLTGSASIASGGPQCILHFEMVFGKTICVLPEEFFEPSSQTPTDPSEFSLKAEEKHSGHLKPTPASCHSSTSCFIAHSPQNLLSCLC